MAISRPPAHRASDTARTWVAPFFKTLAVVVAVALASTAGIVGITAWTLANNLQSNSVDIQAQGAAAPPSIGAFDGGFNILVVGIDNDPSQSSDVFGERDATLNDVNIMLHVSQDHKSAVAVSFPRDLIIQHPECEGPDGESYDAMSAAPVNEAYERGGLGCVVKTISNLTGLDIPYGGVVSFTSVVKLTDAIGGVPICLTSRLIDDNVEILGPDGELEHLDLPAGTYPISGWNALGFLRSRHGVGDGSDLGRISSTQQYLSSLVRQLKDDSTLSNPGKLLSIAQVVADPQNVTLSTSLSSVNTMISMAQALRTVDLNNMVFVQYPGSTNDPDYPGKVVPDQDAADQLFELIKADQPFNLGADSQGIGTTAAPGTTDPNAPVEPPADTAPPVDPDAPVDPNATTPATTGPPTLDDSVKGQTAEQQTCAVPNP